MAKSALKASVAHVVSAPAPAPAPAPAVVTLGDRLFSAGRGDSYNRKMLAALFTEVAAVVEQKEVEKLRLAWIKGALTDELDCNEGEAARIIDLESKARTETQQSTYRNAEQRFNYLRRKHGVAPASNTGGAREGAGRTSTVPPVGEAPVPAGEAPVPQEEDTAPKGPVYPASVIEVAAHFAELGAEVARYLDACAKLPAMGEVSMIRMRRFGLAFNRAAAQCHEDGQAFCKEAAKAARATKGTKPVK